MRTNRNHFRLACTHLVAAVVVLSPMACAEAPMTKPNLSSSEATRVADSEVRLLVDDIRNYRRSPARYDASDDGWWISYSRKSKGHDLRFRHFNILVKDKTRQTSLVIP